MSYLNYLPESEDFDIKRGNLIVDAIQKTVLNYDTSLENVLKNKKKVDIDKILDMAYEEDFEDYKGKTHWQKATDGDILTVGKNVESEVYEQLIDEFTDDIAFNGFHMMILFKEFLLQLSKKSKNDKAIMNNFIKDLRFSIMNKIGKMKNDNFLKLF